MIRRVIARLLLGARRDEPVNRRERSGARVRLALRRGCTTMEAMESEQQSFYDAVGGAETFNAIVSPVL